MRHGQGLHSVAENGHNIRDPKLTEKGEAQCRERRDAFKRHDKIDLLLASPLHRVLQTCEITFQPCMDRGLKIIAFPLAQEATDAASDTGQDVEVLKADFPDRVDFSLVEDGWWKHDGEFALEPKALIKRAADLRRWIKNRPEKEAVLVGHGYFLHFVTGDVNEKGEQTTSWWDEAEIRTFTFVDGTESADAIAPADGKVSVDSGPKVDGEDGAMIKETPESLQRLKENRPDPTE